jgi:hypothetical protein
VFRHMMRPWSIIFVCMRQFYGQSMTSLHVQCCLDGAQKKNLHVHLVIRIHGLLGSSMDESIVIWVIVDF